MSQIHASLLAAILVVSLLPGLAAAQTPEFIAPGNLTGISRDGRFIVFESPSADLVPGDTNGIRDVFVFDRVLRSFERVNVDSDENQALLDDPQSFPQGGSSGQISADGRFVVFTSESANLVPGDTNGAGDVFLRDRVRGTTERVSTGLLGNQLRSGGIQSAISADGRIIAFLSDSEELFPGLRSEQPTIIVRDRETSSSAEAVFGDPGQVFGGVFNPELDDDGRFVLFQTQAMLPFVFDRVTRTSAPAADFIPETAGTVAISLSDDGRFVALLGLGDFTQSPSAYAVADRSTGSQERIDVDPLGQPVGGGGSSMLPALTGDGRFVVFASSANGLIEGDADDTEDLFLRDRVAGVTERVARGFAMGEVFFGGPGIEAAFPSNDARIVVFGDGSSIFVVDRLSGAATLSLTPRTPRTVVGEDLCVTARVATASGPTSGVRILLQLAGHEQRATTAGNGEVEVCFAPRDLPGQLLLNAVTLDREPISVQVQLEVVPPPSTAGCRVRSIGSLVAGTNRAAFQRVRARVLRTRVLGDHIFAQRDGAGTLFVDSLRVETLACDDGSASLFGQAKSGGQVVGYRIDLRDGGRRARDRYRLRLSNGFDSGERSLRNGFVDVRE